MNEDTSLQPLTVTLSREELLAVLDLLRAPTIPGLDREMSGEPTPEQEAFALVVARRALLARGLAQMQANGEFLLHQGLLKSVGTCAFARASILAYYWPAGAQVPERIFGHVRGGDTVAHTRPATVLHRFTGLPTKDALVEHVLAFCKFDASPPMIAFDFTVSRQGFADARQFTQAENAAAATALLVQEGVPNAAAASLVTAWAAAPRISVFQTLTQQGNQAVRTREFTLIQDGQTAWWVAPTPGAGAKTPVRVKTASSDEIRALLADGL